MPDNALSQLERMLLQRQLEEQARKKKPLRFHTRVDVQGKNPTIEEELPAEQVRDILIGKPGGGPPVGAYTPLRNDPEMRAEAKAFALQDSNKLPPKMAREWERIVDQHPYALWGLLRAPQLKNLPGNKLGQTAINGGTYAGDIEIDPNKALNKEYPRETLLHELAHIAQVNNFTGNGMAREYYKDKWNYGNNPFEQQARQVGWSHVPSEDPLHNPIKTLFRRLFKIPDDE